MMTLLRKYMIVPALCMITAGTFAQEPGAKKIADQGNEKGEKKLQQKEAAQQLKEKPAKVSDSTHKAAMHGKKTCGIKKN
ncbi:hypothetical protein QTN47_10245 [Danxiaibacter flavus]|uniref:Pentapeptide MXKDX repeat protein n=1 Tax=Danxiaibacter flavus TaxID=3049108 RepID=A0ABV3ZDC2_9BACT|nr:hypothetical protein QNM32_10250 [Chitinophagaceae bacterium DXS]